jgi:hypothetical protein
VPERPNSFLCRVLPYICIALFIGTCAFAHAQEPTQQQLLDEVRALRAEVKELRGQLTAQTQPSKEEQARAAADVMRDASLHGKMLDVEGFTAGHDQRGFIIQSTDGRFVLHPWFFIQVRDATNYREDGKHNGTEPDWQNGFEIRRAKLILDGNAVTPDLTYQIIWAVDRKTGLLSMEDAWARYHIPTTPFAVRAGQIRDPLDHEQLVFGTQTLGAERSLVDNLFLNGDGIVQGVSVGYGYDTESVIRSEVAFTDGFRSSNMNFQDFSTTNADWGAAGRVEWKATGNWQNYRDFTARGTTDNMLVFGAGVDYTEAGDTAQLLHVVDAQYERPGGLGLYAAYLGRAVRNNAGPIASNGGATGTKATADTYDATVRVTAGWAIGEHWEHFVRYEYINFDPAELPPTAGHRYLNSITLGSNYFFAGWRAKLTGEVTYLPQGSPVDEDGTNILANRGGNEVVVRVQFQFAI